MSFLYVGGQLPFCLGRVPYFHRQNLSQLGYGEGTDYPLELTIAQYAACFWRVKKWQFTGEFAYSDASVSGSSSFNFTFTRPHNESELICLQNRSTQGPFPEAPNEEDLEFTGTITTEDGTEDIDLRLTCDLGYRAQDDQILQAALDVTGNLRCYFSLEMYLSGANSLLISFEEENFVNAGSLNLFLPGGIEKEIPLYNDEDSSWGMTDFEIRPAEYYEWGGLYDPETGDPV